MMSLDATVSVYVVHYNEDDPRKCTALRMVRAGKAVLKRRPPPGSILLDPYSPIPLSPADREIVERRGLTVVDASWNKINASRFNRLRRRAHPRRLPFLIAVNPPHYGMPYRLSSLEAVAAALYITGFVEQAIDMLALYKWGPHFLEVNRKYLDAYTRAATAEDVMRAEAAILSEILGVKVEPDQLSKLAMRLAQGE